MFKKINSVKFRRTFLDFVRNRTKKAKILDPSHIEDVPVHEYPSKPSTETNVYGWGLGEHGALGHYIQKKKKMRNMTDPRFRTFSRPFRMTFAELNKVRDIAAGYGFSAFYVKSKEQWKVFGCGLNTNSQIGYHEKKNGTPLEVLLSPVPIAISLKDPQKTKVIGLSAGRAHLVIVTDSEGVFTLGNNAYGQCGRTVVENEEYKNSRIHHQIPSLDGEKVMSVECGQDHTLFLTENGNVYSCGWGADGQTGLGHYNAVSKPTKLLGDIEGEKIVKLSSKCDCVLALNDKGEVFGWGNSEYSQIFDENDSVQQINRPKHLKKCEGFGKIVDIVSSGSHCMMLNEAGEVFVWGYGILGLGPNVYHSWTPKIIPPILFGRNDFQMDAKVSKIYCGLNFSAAINNYGHIYTWGKNKGGCLGLAHKEDQYFPLRVYINAIGRKLALGVDHALALCNPF